MFSRRREGHLEVDLGPERGLPARAVAIRRNITGSWDGAARELAEQPPLNLQNRCAEGR